MSTSFFTAKWSADWSKTALQGIGTAFGGNFTAVGDFNADGHDDVLVTYGQSNALEHHTEAPIVHQVLLLGKGDGTFTNGTSTLPHPNDFEGLIRHVVVGDFNGDGEDDVVMSLNWENGRDASDAMSNASRQVALMSGDGKLNELDLGFTVWGHAVAGGDLNMDGREDFIIGGFTDDPVLGPGHGTAAFIQNADGTLTTNWLPDRGGAFEAIADFDLDGKAELIDVYAFYDGGPAPYSSGLRLTHLDAAGAIESADLFPGRYERLAPGPAWNGTTTYAIQKDSQGKEYIDNGLQEFKVADMNEDGRPDIVAVHPIADFTEVGDGSIIPTTGHITMSIFTIENGAVKDVPVTFSGWQDPQFGLGNFELIDWNGDGHLDIYVDWEGGGPDNGARIYLNDGKLHFTRIQQSLLPSMTGVLNFAHEAIDANGDGIWDIYGLPSDFDPSWGVLPAKSDVLFLGTKRFYTGPDYTNPALKGAPGFNEQYYLNTHADAASWVHAHHGKTGLDHYLAIGKAKGYLDFAPGTHVYGSDGADKIVLREGDETGDGGKGNDTFTGGAGADKLLGGSGTDTASYAGAHAGVTASLADALSNSGDAAGDTYSSIERLIGSSHNDRLGGNGGANSLSGGSGSDSLDGGAGKDTLNGGSGADHFYFDTALSSGNIDTISSFAHRSDKIELDDAVFLAVGGSLGTSEFYAHSGATKAHDASDRIIYNSKTGYLYYDADGSKAHGHAAVHFATLSGHPSLSYGDFHIA